jgi:conjugative relaxase-like TrwC/TraI family protein
VLSIGKVGGGQADPAYYIESVAKGAEDYYAGAGEAPGRWEGRGAKASGLTGRVEENDFLRTLKAHDADGKTVLGYDLTFSAPKSVSVLFGVGDEALAEKVREAHDEAVRQALGYVEREACWTRRGAGGRRQVKGQGLTVATFRHRTSRAGDPQLHTHAVVVNATQAEGKTTTVFGQPLYAHARTAGFLYQAALREQLTDRVGVEWTAVEHGVADVRGIPEDVIRHFSTRRDEIRERMAEHGGRSAKSAQAAALETRRTKEHDVRADRLRQEWRARAAELGLGRDELVAVLGRQPVRDDRELRNQDTAEAMAAPGGITRQASTFDRRDVLRDWASSHRAGASVRELERLADAWLESSHAVRLEQVDQRKAFGGPRHSTPDMLELETQLLETSRARKGRGIAKGDPSKLERETELSDEQQRLARRLVTSGDGVEVVRAAAGTGKTRTLDAARASWQAADVRVYGCALAARAAVELETLAGIDSTTVARVERDLDQGYGLGRGSVLVIDEAGMVGTRSIARLAAHCAATESKLVLVGDDHQLPEIDAGGAFRRLAKELGAGELRTVRRQAEVGSRRARTAAARPRRRMGRPLQRPRQARRRAHRREDPPAPRRRLVEGEHRRLRCRDDRPPPRRRR